MTFVILIIWLAKRMKGKNFPSQTIQEIEGWREKNWREVGWREKKKKEEEIEKEEDE